MNRMDYVKNSIKELLSESQIIDRQDNGAADLVPDWREKIVNTANEIRRRQLAAIHIGKKSLGLSDEAYRELLSRVAQVHSAADLEITGCRAVLDEMRRLGFVDGKVKRSHEGRPRNMDSPDRGAQLGKIEAMLLEAHRPWAYADAIARRICGVEKIAWCTSEQLRKVIAALVSNAKREGRRTK